MTPTRRLLIGMALTAPALAARAQERPQTAASGTTAFTSRARAVQDLATLSLAPGQLLTDGQVFYRYDPQATAIPDLPGLQPLGDVSALHWGSLPDDRDAAAQNARRINLAADYCRAAGVPLHLPSGSMFIADRLDFSGLRVIGTGTAALRTQAEGPVAAPCQIVLTGTGFTPLRLHGITSMKACGAARQMSPRDGLQEASWELVSLMHADATTGSATPVDLTVGILIEGRSGACLEGLRVLADSGGAQGLDGYRARRNARLFGSFDIGILQIGARQTTMVDVQAMGHFRRYGYLNAAIDLDGDYSDYTSPYETSLIRCHFEGLRAFGLRGPDKFRILDWRADSVELPWADDHPFTLDPGHNRLRLTQVGTGTAGGRSFSYSAVSRVETGGETRLRLSGLQDFDPEDYGAVVPTTAGGANSHIVLRDCQIGGLHVPSGHAANDKAVENAIDNGAVGGFEISGWRCAEADIQGRLQHAGSLAGFIHDCREVVLDLMCEANAVEGHPRAMTWIVSPQHNQNRHAAHPVGGPRWLEWRYGMVTERSANEVDMAPFMPFLPRPKALAERTGRGWFEGYWALRSPRIRYYTREDGTDLNYLPLPALSLGSEAEGYRGPAPQDLLHLRGSADSHAALRLSEGERMLRLFLDTAEDRGLVLQEVRDGALRDVLRSVFDAAGARLQIAGGLEVEGPVTATGGVGFPAVPRAALEDASHAINGPGKRAGLAVFDSTKGCCLVASGGAAADSWNLFDGAVAVRPK